LTLQASLSKAAGDSGWTGVFDVENLFEIARDNASSIEGRCEHVAAEAGNRRAKIEEFSDFVKERARISINALPWDLRAFLESGYQKTARERAEEHATLRGMEAEDVFKEMQAKWYAKRAAFESEFDKGHTFRYGALNLGNVGTTCFGPFCMILRDGFPQNQDVAYLISNSLTDYVSDSGQVNMLAVKRDTAPHSHRHCLAVIKHGKDATVRPSNQWPSLTCGDSEYIEAIFIGHLTTGEINIVRMSNSYRETLWDIAFESYDKDLADEKRALAATFVDILTALRSRGIQLEAIGA
jgi:hypothetical protein